ncbi:MAG: Rossman fold protein, TIGR00730 family [Candidatus Zambryskibacteria bacterium RIFCSPLOWO2_02_FULL_39_26]|uniref:Cytokinin riboside 5'-monophosphate phosphoribohydrolase n=1 Tax=Candidatus Zambryskibacteria bacterium RIFCSPLOWO2_12_FULL_39_23 TaxID=1802776 RepID=A0A1G2UQQ1_9BACT|nr:MAG: Rossman fold protein, TIGR00730 family [Candidatus Zambryskibacteria bacterium RIFCSPHIGHO2_02_39_10]OHB09878.1 MAG: Rossman fold protein, TIGR00730 family [Candidatus Zambryskibacteria bacterium RIFCSPLOWO2_02_FULL_39_26]OHB11701.1 MAG: Rossman fold protein, TIGR00730 family [Candidatus Zambryskibacteria bacterium RIFCSPLOWO2_12_FULL_39_23]
MELHDTTVDRVSLIAKEFTDGFNFLRHYPKSVTIFGGNHWKEEDLVYIKARSLGARIVNDLKYAVFTGGGPGIMEAANRGAYEAGGDSLGLTIELSHHQIQNSYLTKNLDFYYFFSRKVCLGFSAEAFVFFPGGYGTFDEFFEILTLVQTKKIEYVPIILVGSDFWNPLDEFIKKEMLTRGSIEPEDLQLYKITDDENEIIETIRNAPVRIGIKFTHKNLESSGIKIE